MKDRKEKTVKTLKIEFNRHTITASNLYRKLRLDGATDKDIEGLCTLFYVIERDILKLDKGC